MHDALFDSGLIEGKMTIKAVNGIAKKQGFNIKKMKAYIKKQQAEFTAKKNNGANGVIDTYTLAQKLQIRGTPAFIVAPTPSTGSNQGTTSFIPGLASKEQLQTAIDAAK